MRVLLGLSIGVVAGLMLANGALGGASSTAFGATGVLASARFARNSDGDVRTQMSVLVLLTLVSEGGFRKGEISTVVPSFFAFYAFFFGMTYWLFA